MTSTKLKKEPMFEDIKEPILHDTTRRYTLFPIKYPKIFEAYKNLQRSFWVPEEVDLEDDVVEFQTLDKDSRFYISCVLAFFASADCIVNLNLLNFSNEISVPEIVCFWATQSAQETVHSEVYGQLISRLCQTQEEKDHLFNAVETIPAIKSKAEWAIKWLDASIDLPVRIAAWGIVEGLMFASSFAAIAWFKHRNLLKSLGTVNEWISRDESAHADFAALLLREYVVNKPSVELIHGIFREAVEHEFEFVEFSLPCRLIGINCEQMKTYIMYCANRLLKSMGYPALYSKKEAYCPFKWINTLSIEGQSSFFERRVTDYAKSTMKKNNIRFTETF